jgi:hypothetical protein
MNIVTDDIFPIFCLIGFCVAFTYRVRDGPSGDAPMRRRCPVCWHLVARTMHERIEGHWDGVHRPCPGSGETYAITLRTKRTA